MRIDRMRTGILMINLLMAGTAGAQTAPSRVFAGGGIQLSGDNSLSGRTTDPDPLPLAWFIEGGIFVDGPIAIGAELLHGPGQTSSYSSSAGALTEDYEETSWLGILRGRVARSDRVAFDLLGGGGIIFQSRTDSSLPRSGSSAPIRNDTTGHSLALVVGGDIPISMASHVAIVPSLRLYSFRRENLPGGLITTSASTSIAVAVSGRFVW